jgi:hypothetical protein
MEDTQAALLAEQLRHTVDLLRAELDSVKATQSHNTDFMAHRLAVMEKRVDDQEVRIRSATDGVTQFKVFSGLASGGSSILAIIAFLRSVIGFP